MVTPLHRGHTGVMTQSGTRAAGSTAMSFGIVARASGRLRQMA
jgi:hypothetical protein